MARIHRRTVRKGLNDPDNHNGVVTHLEPDILEWEVKWALGSISMNKASGGDGIPELFEIAISNPKRWCCESAALNMPAFGKLSSGHRTRKGKFSFQSQRRVMPKNVLTTTQLHSFHMLARLCSKSYKLSFNSTWTEKFQMYKLDLEKVEEPETKLPTSAGLSKK